MSLNTVRKVMYVVHGIPPEKKGGTENYAINLALSVSRYCEVSIVHRTQNNQQDDYYTKTYNIFSIAFTTFFNSPFFVPLPKENLTDA